MNFTGFIAKRYLFSKKSHNAINIITLISIGGVCIGSMAMIIVLSALNGITGLVLSLYNTFDPDLKIVPSSGKTFAVSAPLTEKIKSIAEINNYSYVLEEKALLKHDDKQTIATLKGVDKNFVRLGGFDSSIVAGSYLLQSDSSAYAVVGAGIANKLSLNVSAEFSFYPLSIYVPKREITAVNTPDDAFATNITFASGVFALNDDFDYKYVLLPINYVADLLGKQNQLSAIEIDVNDAADADEIKVRLQQAIGGNYKVKTRYELNEVLFRTLKSEKWWTFLILAFIMLIGIFTVINAITMLIIEKKKDAAVLRSMGADTSAIKKIFYTVGFYITCIGSLSGIILGLTICYLQMQFGFVPFSDGFVVNAYPIKIMFTDVLYVFATVILIGTIATRYPVAVFAKKYFANNLLPK
jgi:lipoprotein-releasing system permease protein